MISMPPMFEKILPSMRCPRCAGSSLDSRGASICCPSCGISYPIRSGILDLIGNDSAEVITPFQRIMQIPLVVSVYESLWRRAGYFLASSRSFDDEIRTVLRFQEAGDNSRLLDLACGPGVFTRPLAERSKGIVIGLDLSWPMLCHAQRKVGTRGPTNILLMRGSAFRLPFQGASLTYINCCGALHLFDRPDEALREIARTLRRGGCLCVQTTIKPRHSAGLASFLDRFIRFGFFEEAGLKERLKTYGLNIVESERHRISFTFLARNDG